MSGRVWFGPAGSEIVGLTEEGALITAGLDAGVGPMTEITDFLTDVRLTREDG